MIAICHHHYPSLATLRDARSLPIHCSARLVNQKIKSAMKAPGRLQIKEGTITAGARSGRLFFGVIPSARAATILYQLKLITSFPGRMAAVITRTIFRDCASIATRVKQPLRMADGEGGAKS